MFAPFTVRQLHMTRCGTRPSTRGPAHQYSIEHLTGYFEWLQTERSPFKQPDDNETFRRPAHLLAKGQTLVDWLDECGERF